jgi:nitrate reductase molybdenum cofactor assembly chaperone NarJ/NarW
MTDEKRTLLKLLSLCLAYPDAEILEALPEMGKTAAGLGDPRSRERLSHFMALMKSQSLLKLQEHYTAVFDMDPSASLNLTYHLLGDREERGRALAELLEAYLQAGFEPAVNELPDFLPLLLEFMAAAPQAETRAPIMRCLAAVPALAGRLKESGSMYAVPLELLCGVFPEATDLSLSPAGAIPAGVSGA